MNEGLFFRRADGAEIPVKEVEGLKGNGLLILMTETFLREEDMQKMQQSIERRIGDGTRVLVLDARIKKGYAAGGVNVEYICTLPEKAKKKDCSGCEHCGWEAAEAERRRAYLREHGLTLCADGLRRLIISKNGGTEELKYKVCDHCGAHLDNGETCDCQRDAGESNSDEERSANNDRN